MILEKIIKRDGRIVRFEQDKITNAIKKAVKAVGGTDLTKRPKYLSNLVVKQLKEGYGKINKIPTVEEIQDLVQKTLIKEGCDETAIAYILYRQSHKELRELRGIFDTIEVVEDYINDNDWMIKENSNMDFSLQGLNNFISTKIITNYWLGRVYPEKIKKAHKNGDIHIHDLGTLGPYCVGWDLEDLLMTGFRGVSGKAESGPAKHLRTAMGQMVNFFYTLQGESAGAQAFSNFDTLLAPFIRKDNLNYREVKQCMQEFLFNLAVPTRVGFQTPFTNITMDLKVPDYLKDKPVIINMSKEDIEKKYQKRINSLEKIVNKWKQQSSAEFSRAIDFISKKLRYRTDNPSKIELEELHNKIGGKLSEWKVTELFLNASSLPPKKQREYLINGAMNLFKEEKEENFKMLNSTYGDYQKEMDMMNQAFAECMLNGDIKGRVFTFPIPTYNITKDFDWDNPNYDLIWEMTAKYGIPYFSNFINSDMNPEDARSMCCRLRLDQKKLRKRGGGLFGANPQTGSIGVVTINLPRIGYTCKDSVLSFFKRLEELMDIAKNSLEIKRKTLERFTDAGLYPYSKFYLRNVKKRFDKYWKNHFSTIGLLGMNEAVMNLFPKENIGTEKGREFAIEVLNFMREKLEEYQEETGDMYNLEATPGEGTTYRFARADKKRFPDIIVANEEAVEEGGHPFYTNSSQLPVNYTDDLIEALDLQDELQTKYTGGTVFHSFIGEKLEKNAVKTLVRKISENYELPYFTITPTFSICQEHGYLSGEHPTCPTCNSSCEVYSRVVGYLRPVKQWNEGKQAEWKERELFKV